MSSVFFSWAEKLETDHCPYPFLKSSGILDSRTLNDRHLLTPVESNYPWQWGLHPGLALEKDWSPGRKQAGSFIQRRQQANLHHLAEPELRQLPRRPHPDQSCLFMHTCYPELHFFLHLNPKFTSVLLRLRVTGPLHLFLFPTWPSKWIFLCVTVTYIFIKFHLTCHLNVMTKATHKKKAYN